MKSVLPLTCFHLCFNSCDCSFAGGAVDRCHTVGQERHAGFPREHPCEHTWHRALLLHVPQHQRDLQTDGAASQHRHETAAGQRELRRWPLSPQTRQDPEKRLSAQEVSRPDRSQMSLEFHCINRAPVRIVWFYFVILCFLLFQGLRCTCKERAVQSAVPAHTGRAFGWTHWLYTLDTVR